jgi:hypothetical protein
MTTLTTSSTEIFELDLINSGDGALTIDSVTGSPIVLRNDDNMGGIFVYGFDTDRGVQL